MMWTWGMPSCDETGAHSFLKYFFTHIQIEITELDSFL